MLTVEDIWDDVRDIFGDCDETKQYKYLSDAIELASIKGEWDPLRSYVDICCTGNCVTLPSEVETPLAVLVDGHPTLAVDQLFNFHLNGPGDDWCSCGFEWMNQGLWPTFADIPGPRKIYAYSTNAADIGKTITIRGEDGDGTTLRDPDTGEDGQTLPIQFGASALTPYKVSRIFRIEKPVTVGRVKIAAPDYSNARCNQSGTLISDMQYWETVPQYRRIKLSRAAQHARIYFRRRTFRVTKQTDLIPLHQRFALRAFLQAVKGYVDEKPDVGLTYEAQGVRWFSEKEFSLQPPGGIPVQVDMRGGLYDARTDDIGND